MDLDSNPATPNDPQESPDSGDTSKQAARRLFDTAAQTTRTPITFPATRQVKQTATTQAQGELQEVKNFMTTQVNNLNSQVSALTEQMTALMAIIANQQSHPATPTAALESHKDALSTPTAANQTPYSANKTTADVANQEGNATYRPRHPPTALSTSAAIHSPCSDLLSQHNFRKTDLEMSEDCKDMKPRPSNPSTALSAFRRIKPAVVSAIHDIKQPGIMADIAMNTFKSEIRGVLTSSGDHTIAAILVEALTGQKATDNTTQNLLRLAVKCGSVEEIDLQAQQIRETGRYNRKLAALTDVTKEPTYANFNPETDQGKDLWAAILNLLLSYWQRPKSARADQQALETSYLSMSCTEPSEASAHINHESELYTKLEAAHVIYSDQQRIRAILSSCSTSIRSAYKSFIKRMKERHQWNHLHDTDIDLFAADLETVTDAMDSDDDDLPQQQHSPAAHPAQDDLKKSNQRPQQPDGETRPCWDHQYLADGCSRGEHCPWLHEGESAAKKLRYATERGDCRAFLNGACDRGDQCKFNHQEPPSAHPAQDVPRDKAPSVCFDYQNGNCRRGDQCKFVHAKREETQVSHASMDSSNSHEDWDTSNSESDE